MFYPLHYPLQAATEALRAPRTLKGLNRRIVKTGGRLPNRERVEGGYPSFPWTRNTATDSVNTG
jgi:hypothetical protein